MKTKNVLAVLILAMLIFTACHNIERTSYEDVSVTITDAYYRPAYVTPKTDAEGKLIGYTQHDAEGIITVLYNGYEHYIYGAEYYYRFYDKIGKTVSATLRVIEYDDGKIKREIVALKED